MMMDEAACLKKLTTYCKFTMQKAPPRDPKKDKLSWVRAEITEENIAQEDIIKQVKKLLNESRESVWEKKEALTNFAQQQINNLIDEHMTKERDQAFQWSLVQLDTKTRPISRSGKRDQFETITITVYLRRAPRKDLNPVTLLNNILRSNAAKAERFPGPPPVSMRGQMVQPLGQIVQPLSASTDGQGPSVGGGFEDPVELQKKIMQQSHELARKRRQEEEVREEAARRERVAAKLALLPPMPEKKKGTALTTPASSVTLPKSGTTPGVNAAGKTFKKTISINGIPQPPRGIRTDGPTPSPLSPKEEKSVPPPNNGPGARKERKGANFAREDRKIQEQEQEMECLADKNQAGHQQSPLADGLNDARNQAFTTRPYVSDPAGPYIAEFPGPYVSDSASDSGSSAVSTYSGESSQPKQPDIAESTIPTTVSGAPQQSKGDHEDTETIRTDVQSLHLDPSLKDKLVREAATRIRDRVLENSELGDHSLSRALAALPVLLKEFALELSSTAEPGIQKDAVTFIRHYRRYGLYNILSSAPVTLLDTA
jgi:hypothetical protein